MNPLRWVRWKVLAAAVIVLTAAYFLGLDAIALSGLNNAGASSDAAKWRVEDLALGLLSGDLRLDEVLLESPRRESAPRRNLAAAQPNTPPQGDAKVMEAKSMQLDISVGELLKKRYVVEEAVLSDPTVTIVRREDGTSNVGDLGGGKPVEEPATDREPGEPAEPKEPTDWVEVAKTWYERIRWLGEKLKKDSGEEGQQDRKQGEKEEGITVDYTRRIDFPFAVRPGVLVREIRADDLTIRFADPDVDSSIPPLENGVVRLKDVSSRPNVHGEPIALEVEGDVAGARFKLAGTVDLRGERSAVRLAADTGDLPVSLVQKLVGRSLPVNLRSGVIRLAASCEIKDGGTLNIAPRLAFQGVTLEPKAAGGKIAGLPASDFTRAFNEASRALGKERLVIEDLRITGTLRNPSFEWGDSVRKLVTAGGKAFARNQLNKGVSKGKELLNKESAKLQDELKEDLGNKVDKLPGAEEAKNALKDALNVNPFGGGKKEQPKKE